MDDSIAFRVRVATRLAWLDLRQKDLAKSMGIESSTLSRTLRATSPHSRTIHRLATALGLTSEELLGNDRSVLTKDHPAMDRTQPRALQIRCLRQWCETQELVDE